MYFHLDTIITYEKIFTFELLLTNKIYHFKYSLKGHYMEDFQYQKHVYIKLFKRTLEFRVNLISVL